MRFLLLFGANDSCSLDRVSKPKRHVDFSKTECEEIKTSLAKIDSEEQKVPGHEVFSIDDPRFDFNYKGKAFPVLFQMPQECDILKSGELNCHKQKLSSAQKILYLVRSKLDKKGRG